MRLLVDNALSPVVAKRLEAAGHDARHVRDEGMASATDAEVLELAVTQDRVIVSADTDFGTLLTLRELPRPSFVLLRGELDRRPESVADLLIRELPGLEEDLREGAIVVITEDRIRVRRLSRSTAP